MAVRIQTGFSQVLRVSAAEMYDAAFARKLRVAVPDNAGRVAVVADGMKPAKSLVGLDGLVAAGRS